MDTKDYDIDDRESECCMYNSLISALPDQDRKVVSDCLYRIIKRYQSELKTKKTKAVIFKPKTMPAAKNTKTYIYNLDDIPEPLSDMLILCLREYIFIQ
jgi:hypothetical protein